MKGITIVGWCERRVKMSAVTDPNGMAEDPATVGLAGGLVPHRPRRGEQHRRRYAQLLA